MRIDAEATGRWMRILAEEKMVRSAPLFADLVDTAVVDSLSIEGVAASLR